MNEKIDEGLLFCYNCHTFTHLSRECTESVDSYGVICYHTDQTGDIRYLIVERRFSFAYVDFIRGKYDIFDYVYLQKLFNRMTLLERCLILNSSFHRLWEKLWINNSKYRKSLSKLFYYSSAKFYILRNGFVEANTNRRFKTLLFIDNCSVNYKSSEWYFPKGRRKVGETGEKAAIREFTEETNVLQENIEMLKIDPLEEKHISIDDRTYLSIFYIAKYIPDDTRVFTFGRNEQQDNEIGCVEWVNKSEFLNRLRPYENGKRSFFEKTSELIKNIEEKNAIEVHE